MNLLELWRVARKRARSPQDYLEFQQYQASLLIGYLEQHGVSLAGRRLVDLGSGVGGYGREFARRGAAVISIDLTQPRREPGAALAPVRGDATRVPLRTGSVDVVFCASLIEHVAQPDSVLREIWRVLRPGGEAYVSFPPYYSPLGGHEFSPYHYLGERLAVRLVNRRRVVAPWVSEMYAADESAGSFAGLYRGWGLYRMTIRRMRQLIPQTGFVCRDISTRYWPVSFVRWPVLGEVLTWHAQFLLAKPAADEQPPGL